jgi:phosphoglycolate phosphatase
LYGLVLIDLDGTLVDSVPDLTYCLDEMMKRIGQPPPGEARTRAWIGNGVERLVKRALTGAMYAEPDLAEFDRAYPIFLELYAANTSQRSQLYPGVKEGLDWMREKGYHLGCVTNKAARFTEPLLRDLGIYDYFGVIVSGDTLPVKKPDPGPLLYAAKHFNASPEQSLLIGDSMNDVQAARAAGFNVICVSYGYNHGEDIRDAEPDRVIDSLAELATVLSGNVQL